MQKSSMKFVTKGLMSHPAALLSGLRRIPTVVLLQSLKKELLMELLMKRSHPAALLLGLHRLPTDALSRSPMKEFMRELLMMMMSPPAVLLSGLLPNFLFP